MVTALLGCAWGYVAAAAAAVAVVGMAFLKGRRARRDAVTAAAARHGEEARQRGEAAEREGRGEDVVARLRRGGF